MGIDHIFTVGNMSREGSSRACRHVPGYAVIDGDGVEFGGKTAQTLYLGLDQLAGLMQMGVAGLGIV